MTATEIAKELEKTKKKADAYRRALIRCGIRTQFRDVYDIVIETLGIRHANELIAKARKAGIR